MMTARTGNQQRDYQRINFVTEYIADEFQVKSFYLTVPFAEYELREGLTKTNSIPERISLCNYRFKLWRALHRICNANMSSETL